MIDLLGNCQRGADVRNNMLFAEEEEEGPDDISDEEGPDDMIECKDLSSKCAKKQKQGKKCKSRWMRKNCEKTCKRCSNLIQLVSSTRLIAKLGLDSFALKF